ncbi:TetR/AcrR family transcriptional regulator [Gayadomonas joobiniege]|uniref:TetR/AcrR family transcriptional regulator n=1 Tax=Gayadomonas joobiniege TaxID=1234606 RepID=UPI00037B4149|nr:TetR family transcriptional regulator [Gayadomonas joobiniege]
MSTTGKRARTDEAKNQKRERILQAASDLFDQNPDALPTSSEIAQHSGVAKGTVYLYFKSKEEIFLAMLKRHYQAWFNDINEALQDDKPNIEQWINALCHYIEQQPQFFSLASLSTSIIEKNVAAERLTEFRQALSEMLNQCAKILATKINQDNPVNCAQLLMRSYALLLGIWQISHPAEPKTQNFSLIQPDFKQESRQALEQLWRGYIDDKSERSGSRFWGLSNIFAKTD